MRKIPEKQLALATLLSLGDSSGSGFIFQSEEGVYLITAKHVLFDESQNLRTKELEITCQTIVENDDSVIRYRINLEKVIVKFHKSSDVAIIQIGKKLKGSNKMGYVDAFEKLQSGNSQSVLLKKEYILLMNEVLISNDVYVSGYPTSLGLQTSAQFDYSKPLLRKGIVSNIYKSARTIILDCPVYGGNSGGPVIQLLDIDGKANYRVIGIISQFIPYVQRWKNDKDRIVNVEYMNSGYSVATSMDVVLELINEIES